MADLTAVAGNPAFRIKDQYQKLMNIHDIDILKNTALSLLDGGGISKNNATKFKKAISSARNTTEVQRYLTNFMLAGAGLAVS